MKRRLVVITEIISPYRIPVFNALARNVGIDLHVIFLAENDPTMRDWLVYKDDIQFSYEVLMSWRRRILNQNVLLNWGMARALRRAAPDAIVCGGYNYLASWTALLWAGRHRVRFLLWVESHAKDHRAWFPGREASKAAYMRRCDGCVVPGRASFEYVRSYGFAERNIFLAPNAVDNRFFTQGANGARQSRESLRLELNLPTRYFLFVGRLVPQKGVFDLLEAYGRLTAEVRAEVGLVFAGAGPARGELEKRARAIRPGRVHFAGFVQREQLPSYYGLADVFVLPTLSDPWGLVINEAMASGLSVVVTDVAGCVPDLMQDGLNGAVVAANDPHQLSRTMQHLAENVDLRTNLGRRSWERVQNFSPEACAAGIANAILGTEAKIDG